MVCCLRITLFLNADFHRVTDRLVWSAFAQAGKLSCVVFTEWQATEGFDAKLAFNTFRQNLVRRGSQSALGWSLHVSNR